MLDLVVHARGGPQGSGLLLQVGEGGGWPGSLHLNGTSPDAFTCFPELGVSIMMITLVPGGHMHAGDVGHGMESPEHVRTIYVYHALKIPLRGCGEECIVQNPCIGAPF